MRLHLLLSTLLIGSAIAASKQPNILFFLVDDMGWQETSVPFGPEPTQLNRDYRTPNMERLASNSVLFTNAYASAVCSPTRVSIMTGQNAARHQVTCWTLRKDTSPEQRHKTLDACEWPLNGLQPPGSDVPRSIEAKTLPMLLQDAGYKTIHVGKGHFGAQNTPGADPGNLGFDVNIAGSYMGGPGSYHGDRNFSAAWRNGGHIWDIPGLEKYHGQKINLTEALTLETIAELERTVKADKPFYLYMSHYTVHAPWEADRRFIDAYKGKPNYPGQKATLASMLESMDRSLGDLLDTLDRLGVADNTIVLFMSDNGSPAQCPPNLPLRGHKVTAYEGGNRVPMIVHLPGVTHGTVRTDTPMIVEDVFPTILGWAGVDEVPQNDGVSFEEIIHKPETDRSKRPLFWHYPNLYDQPPFSSVRYGDLKLIYWHTSRKIELYNLAEDLGEKNNLAKERPEDAQRLAKLLSSHLRKTDALMPIERESGRAVPFPDSL